MKRWGFSPARFWAMVVKEFIQMRRDRVTFAMMVGVPLLQLTLFGFAINSDPKHLPAVWRAPQGGLDIEHHTREWTSGAMGGGKVPADFEWRTNPKVAQEELGANVPATPAPLKPA